MNLDVIISYIPLYIEAFLLTVKIGWLGIFLALAIGIIVAFVMHFKIPFLSGVAVVYVELFRNTPLLVQLFLSVIMPQALSQSVPGILANVIFLLKETSVFSAISLMDLMFTAKDLIGLYYDTKEALFLLVIFYIVMLLPVSAIGSYIEKKARFRTLGV